MNCLTSKYIRLALVAAAAVTIGATGCGRQLPTLSRSASPPQLSPNPQEELADEFNGKASPTQSGSSGAKESKLSATPSRAASKGWMLPEWRSTWEEAARRFSFANLLRATALPRTRAKEAVYQHTRSDETHRILKSSSKSWVRVFYQYGLDVEHNHSVRFFDSGGFYVETSYFTDHAPNEAQTSDQISLVRGHTAHLAEATLQDKTGESVLVYRLFWTEKAPPGEVKWLFEWAKSRYTPEVMIDVINKMEEVN